MPVEFKDRSAEQPVRADWACTAVNYERTPNEGAHIRAADPHLVEEAVDAMVTRVELTEAELSGADGVILLTDHDAFDFEQVSRHTVYVLDCRRVLSGSNIETL